eukprot:7439695-Pyramimonas_sp.AAC.1
MAPIGPLQDLQERGGWSHAAFQADLIKSQLRHQGALVCISHSSLLYRTIGAIEPYQAGSFSSLVRM